MTDGPADRPAESFVRLGGRRFAYLDFGGPGPAVLALHGHFGRGRIFAPLAAALAGRYRVLALDQRGHGLSDNGGEFTPDAYAADAAAFLEALGPVPAAVLGHSMGGAVAFHLARRRPDLVAALVVADMTTLNREPETRPVLDVSGWPRRAPTRRALARALAERGVPAGYFMDSAAEFPDGWGFLFDTADMTASQAALTGDFTAVWNASAQPALLLRAADSFLLTPATARRMARERPNTRLVEVPDSGHWLYADAPDAFAHQVRAFLDHAHPAAPATAAG
ncbi:MULTISPECIES: alpha/beta fold hydrolase [Streptomycetaceae]|uniref:alpha/beta fold hydrolase n=1 Tax=Streptomycetaceae TaxID=2062 RepID=UPI00093C9718|nr:alpha/beta hydrolase [Streptomyces sp. CB02056]OKH97171.1 alpha/beta hydrolase [Streptomyces sp. CB02056]